MEQYQKYDTELSHLHLGETQPVGGFFVAHCTLAEIIADRTRNC